MQTNMPPPQRTRGSRAARARMTVPPFLRQLVVYGRPAHLVRQMPAMVTTRSAWTVHDTTAQQMAAPAPPSPVYAASALRHDGDKGGRDMASILSDNPSTPVKAARSVASRPCTVLDRASASEDRVAIPDPAAA